jgi:hypothetical protein
MQGAILATDMGQHATDLAAMKVFLAENNNDLIAFEPASFDN